MSKVTELWKSISRYDRLCVKCQWRKPIRGGKILGRGLGPERFICSECRAPKEATT